MSFQEQLNKAFQEFEKGHLTEAEHIYEELFSRELSAKEEIQVRFNYGYYLLERKRFEEAIDNYRRTLVLAQNENNKELISQSYHQIGMVYRVMEQYDKALDQFQQEREYINRHFPDNILFLAANSYEIGYTHLLNNQLGDAKKHLDLSIRYALESGDYIMIACYYRGLGDYYGKRSNLDKAMRMYKESIAFFKQADDIKGMQEVKERVVGLGQ